MTDKYEQHRGQALATISKSPGITQRELSKLLAVEHASEFDSIEKAETAMSGVIGELARKHKIVRVQTAEAKTGTYALYMTIPPGVDPKLFEPRKRKATEVIAATKAAHQLVRGAMTPPPPQHIVAPPTIPVREAMPRTFAVKPPQTEQYQEGPVPGTTPEMVVFRMADGVSIGIPTKYAKQVMHALQDLQKSFG